MSWISYFILNLQCRSGHVGLPLGCAEIGAQLWGKHLIYNPEDPLWLNRDRFVLSAGHGSMFLYSWLRMAGYDLSIEDLKKFRTKHSKTPGHPEYSSDKHHTPGVEATTGPLGAGVGNAVGMAVAAKHAAAKYNTDQHKIIDHHIIALCGDGCLQEGVSFESVSFAGHEGLDNLILIYDYNQVTLDQMASFTQSEDHAKRFEALGWNTITINGNNLDEIDQALTIAKQYQNSKPTIIIAHTIIGRGIEEIQGTYKAHGEAGIIYQNSAKIKLNLPENESFYVSKQTKEYFYSHQQLLKKNYNNWNKIFQNWKELNPLLSNELEIAIKKEYPNPTHIFDTIPPYCTTKNVATRQSNADILQYIAKLIPQYLSGSADLFSSTKNYIQNGGDYGKSNKNNKKSYIGKNIYYGVREHGMGTIMNGIAYYGLNIVSSETFLVFSDYLRPAIRIAALSHLPVQYIFTHDSISVGEDGPTHQPVDNIEALRIIPNLDVIRPADPEEVVGAYAAAIERTNGPTAIILTRQNVRTLHEIPINVRREGVLKGGYIARLEAAALTHIIISTGSELQLALDAAIELGNSVRVVSIPCIERFERQSEEYRESVLPSSCTKRVAIEAGGTSSWYKYTGLHGRVIGVGTFGFSTPGEEVMAEFGITKADLIRTVHSL